MDPKIIELAGRVIHALGSRPKTSLELREELSLTSQVGYRHLDRTLQYLKTSKNRKITYREDRKWHLLEMHVCPTCKGTGYTLKRDAPAEMEAAIAAHDGGTPHAK